MGHIFVYSCPNPLQGQLWPRVGHVFVLFFKVVSWFFMVFGWFPWFFKVVSWVFMVFGCFPWFSWFQVGLSWFQVGFSWFFSKMYPPKLYPGPMIQSRSAARRAAQDLVLQNMTYIIKSSKIVIALLFRSWLLASKQLSRNIEKCYDISPYKVFFDVIFHLAKYLW